ncbi:glutamate--tRNA ligase, partial [Xylanibacter rodentium]
MSERRVRVRFAPSPTGALHIGGVRTALYNYLFARQHGGDLVFRIEDTDSNRFVPGAEEYIIESFRWLGIKFDEGVSFGGNHGPYRQSERRDIYKTYVKQLLDAGKAYIAFDTPEELEAKRKETDNFQYDARTRMQMRNSLTMSKEEVEALIAGGNQYVVRFLIEPGVAVHVDDLIRGDVRIMSDILDDKVLYKSADELPTYHLANIVDDHLMEITHVIRGEEWLPSAPLHVLLYRAFGWEDTMPRFAHLPLLLKPEGKGKLSKRDGDRLGFPVFPLEWHDPKTGEVSSGYRESGYFPEAIVNFLALLGWNPGTEQELFSLDELVPLFDITKCSKAGARFDYQKCIWFNHEYILKKTPEEIAALFAPIVREHVPGETTERITEVTRMMKDRVSFVSELWPLCSFFFEAPSTYDEKTRKKRWKEDSPAQMAELIAVLEGIDDFSMENQERVVEQWIEEKDYKLGNIMNAWRLMLVGEGKGPGMFDISAFLGKE